MEQLKTEYNRLLLRHDKACSYFDDMTIPAAKRELQIPAFQGIIKKMSAILLALQEQGHDATDDEAFHGFPL